MFLALISPPPPPLLFFNKFFPEISGHISEYNNNHIIGTTFVVLQEILQAENVIINILWGKLQTEKQ